MSEVTLSGVVPAVDRPRLDHPVTPLAIFGFLAIVAAGLLFVAYSIYVDVDATQARITSFVPYALLAVALIIALGFEFVNGFHDTANAVATVIYTHSLQPFAVVWSASSISSACCFPQVPSPSASFRCSRWSLIPASRVERRLCHGVRAPDRGHAVECRHMVARPAGLELAHTLIGSIIGVGVMNALLRGRDGTSGVDWDQAFSIGKTLLVSPVVGFLCSAILLLVMKALVRNPTLYEAPKRAGAPPWWIRVLLIFTCTGVSFAHGSNDGRREWGSSC